MKAPTYGQALRLALRLEMDGIERMTIWANHCPVCAIRKTIWQSLRHSQGFIQVDATCNVGIHRHEAKQEIAPRASFHDAEQQSCHFNDLTESPM
jgi:hypothetical protein